MQIINIASLFAILTIFYNQTENKNLSNTAIIVYFCIATFTKIISNVITNLVNINEISKYYYKISDGIKINNFKYSSNRIKLKVSLTILTLVFAGSIAKYRTSIEEIKFYHTFKNLKPDIMAHRGSTKNSMENTFESIREAIEYKSDYSEIDVVLTKDNIVVLSHDDNLKRLTGKNVNISEITFDELKKIKMENKQTKEKFDFVDLKSILDYSSGKIKLNIELKPFNNNEYALAKEVAKLVGGKNHEVIISSISSKALLEFKAIDPSISCGLILAVAYGRFPDARFVDFFCVEEQLVTVENIRKIQQKGKRVYVWTTNTEESLTSAISQGVDGVITDDVELSKEVIDNMEINFNSRCRYFASSRARSP